MLMVVGRSYHHRLLEGLCAKVPIPSIAFLSILKRESDSLVSS